MRKAPALGIHGVPPACRRKRLREHRFPLISSGIYGYPKEEALRVASEAIRDFLTGHDLDVTLAVFDKSAFTVSRKLLGAVESYIDEHYVDTLHSRRRELLDVERQALSKADARLSEALFLQMPAPATLDDLVGSLDEPFSDMLLRLIDAKGMTDGGYKRANLDRKLFQNQTAGYMPSKRTAIASPWHCG